MSNPSSDLSPQIDWDQAVQLALGEREDETARVLRSLDEALIEDDRAEVLRHFDRAIVLFAQQRDWHQGLVVAREIYKTVSRWVDFDTVPYVLIVAQFAHNYAMDLQQARVFKAAEDFYAEALSIFQKYGDSIRALLTAHQLGRVQQDQGEYAQAEQSYRASLEIAREQSDDLHIAKNLFQLGQLAQMTGRSQRSASIYHEVLALADTTSSAPLWTAAAHQLGILAQVRGEYVEARNWFERALERARQSDNAHGAADALHQLGMIAHEQGNYGRAAELYHASLSNADQGTDTVPTLYQLAQAAQACGDLSSAKDYARQSLSLAQAQGNFDGIRRVRDFLQRLARERAVATC